MSLTTDEEMPSSSRPGVMSKRNQLTKIVSQKFNTDFTEEMLACDIDLDKFDESELQLIVGDMKMEYDANGDGVIDGVINGVVVVRLSFLCSFLLSSTFLTTSSNSYCS